MNIVDQALPAAVQRGEAVNVVRRVVPEGPTCSSSVKAASPILLIEIAPTSLKEPSAFRRCKGASLLVEHVDELFAARLEIGGLVLKLFNAFLRCVGILREGGRHLRDAEIVDVSLPSPGCALVGALGRVAEEDRGFEPLAPDFPRKPAAPSRSLSRHRRHRAPWQQVLVLVQLRIAGEAA